MDRDWNTRRQEWLQETALPDEVSNWAIGSITKFEKKITELDAYHKERSCDSNIISSLEKETKELKRKIKAELTTLENGLDDISLNSPNSYKLQVSVPSNLNYLMKAWAAAEGRDLSSVALQCLEIGIREIKSKGAIPHAAIKRYENACEKRIALAEANHIWEKHENFSYTYSD
tara:strand:- start:170 stop:691 length:522 start_codon:yes stop_codon:yes gene_type:complete